MVNGLTRFNKMRQVEAVGTGLPTQILTNTISGAMFAGAGLVDPLAAVTLGSASILGAMGGVRLGNSMNEHESRGVMGAFMVALAPLMALSPLLQEDGDADNDCRYGEAQTEAAAEARAATARPATADHWTAHWQPERLWEEANARGPAALSELLGLGTLVGVISGTLGVGATPVMIAYLALNRGPNRVDEYKACVGTALVAVTPNVTTGSISHAMMGSMQWRMVPILGVGTAIGALCGSSIALYIPNTLMQQVFAAFCGITGFAMLRKAPFLKRLLQKTIK